jgi:hypothetical protein
MENQQKEKVSSELLLERKEDIEKAINSFQYHKVISCLKVMKKTLITRELLQKTLVGKTLKRCSELQVTMEHGDKEAEAS